MKIVLWIVVLVCGLSVSIYGIKKQNKFYKYMIFFAIGLMLLSDVLDNMN